MPIEFALKESAGNATALSGNKWRAKIIAADVWGSSAYYPAEVLERDGSRVFTAGLQMFQNHQTEDEKWQRPEGAVENLVGKLISDAAYEADGPDGPGLYADVEFYESYVGRISEIGKDIGLSVRAHGLTEDAEMDGRIGPVLVALLAADSVDVVTRAGAGGKLTSILESDRDLAGRPVETNKEGTQSMTDVTKEDFEALKLELITAINSIGPALTEALKPAPVEAKTAEELEAEAKADEEAEGDAVVIDHIAVVEALAEAGLPTVAAKDVVKSLNEGATLEEAIKHQTDLREAFRTNDERGTVIIESGKTSGIAYALELLG